jgi:hypothetical protein
MAITTLEHVIAGVQPPVQFYKATGTMEAAGLMHSLFYGVGLPGAAVAPTSALTGDSLTSYSGQLPMPSFANNTHLLRFSATSTINGTLFLCDRLWHNATIAETTTTGQTINSTAWPARDANGSTDGVGVMVGIEVSTNTTNAGAITNTTLTYTNSANANTRTATIPSTMPGGGWPITALAGSFVPFTLQAGDDGVRSIQTLTLGTSYGGGEIHLVAYRVIAVLELLQINVAADLDMTGCGFPRMYDNTVPWLLWQPSNTSNAFVRGAMVVAQG